MTQTLISFVYLHRRGRTGLDVGMHLALEDTATWGLIVDPHLSFLHLMPELFGSEYVFVSSGVRMSGMEPERGREIDRGLTE